MKPCCAQEFKPGLPGMAPSKWITVKHTVAPGRLYRSEAGTSKKYTQEDCYIRAWIPIIHKSNFAIVLGPHYRTEQMEFKSYGDNPINQLSSWKLRSMGLDLKSFYKLDSTSYLVVASNINKSGNLTHESRHSIPYNYSFTSVYMKKKSDRKEIGFGVMVNKSDKIAVLPVFVFNYNNVSGKSGIEIALPKKVSYRMNLSPTDIIYFKSEVITRRYYTYDDNNQPTLFRMIDLDTGFQYNKQLNRLIGVEIFGGYRSNISKRLPSGIVPIRTSGLAASIEIYVRPPFKSK